MECSRLKPHLFYKDRNVRETCDYARLMSNVLLAVGGAVEQPVKGRGGCPIPNEKMLAEMPSLVK